MSWPIIAAINKNSTEVQTMRNSNQKHLVGSFCWCKSSFKHKFTKSIVYYGLKKAENL